jgi:hypothetical protein
MIKIQVELIKRDLYPWLFIQNNEDIKLVTDDEKELKYND